MEFLDIRDLFIGMPIIIALPDREQKTIHLGHKFYPRFLSYMDSNFEDIALVLNKMLRNTYAKENIKERSMSHPEAQQR
jgi:hypothetical protein